MAIKLQVQEDNVPLRVPFDLGINLRSDGEIIIIEDYDNLEHKPQIEGVTLEGNKTFAELGLVEATETEAGLMSAEDKQVLDNLDSVYQPVSERVTTVDSDSTDSQYPTAKAVYDVVAPIEQSLSEGYDAELASSGFQRGWLSGMNSDYAPIIEDNSNHRYISNTTLYHLVPGDYIEVTSATLEVTVGYYTAPGTALVKILDYTKLPNTTTLPITVEGWYGVSCRKSSSGPAISPSEYNATIRFYYSALTKGKIYAERVPNEDAFPTFDFEVANIVAGENAYVSNGKLTYASSSTRGRSQLLSFPNGYNYLQIIAAPGYAVTLIEVYDLSNYSAKVVEGWTRPPYVIKISHTSLYIAQVAMRNPGNTFVLPGDGIVARIRFYHEPPLKEYFPAYNILKNPQRTTLYECLAAGTIKQPQGMGFGDGKLLVCTPGSSGSNDGKFQLYDVYARKMVKTVNFAGYLYGHMNDVAYRNGKWYIPYYNADGVAQDKCFVFDSTLTNPTEIPLLNEDGNAFACFRFAYDKSADEFYAAAYNDYTFLVYDANLTYKRTLTLSGSTTIAGSTKTWLQGCETDGINLYICNTANDFSVNSVSIFSLSSGEFIGTLNIPITGHELEAVAYDWDTGMWYLMYYDKPTGYRGYKIQRINFYSEPNVFVPNSQANADWNSTEGVSQILNKPTIPAAQVNSDWDANSGVEEILNKPTKTSAFQNDGADGTSTYVEADELAAVATSGNYNDLQNLPTIPAAQVNADWDANSGVAQILNKPTIPAAQVNSDWNAISGVEEILNKPTKTSAFQNDGSDGNAAYLETDETAFRTARIPYGECDNTSTSTAFMATVPGITELKDGVCMLLYNGVVTSASGFTININGLGAKPCYNNMTMGNPVTPTNPTRDTTIFNINYAFLFVYSETLVSGGCWIGYRGYDANTNTIGYQLRTNNSTMKASDKFYRYRLLFTSADGTKWVPANTSTSTNATSARTPNTRAIDPFGEIVWYGTTTAIEANANVTAAQLWQEYYGSYTNIGYSFNNTGSAATMTANQPIYIKCTPQADGSAIIDPTTPYTQTLPTTEDGKIYIYLGRAASATLFEITMNHPVYFYHDGGIRLWNGQTPLPTPPATDGTYKLTCTVLNGTPTYSWEA